MVTKKITQLILLIIISIQILSCTRKIQVDKTYINGNVFNGETFESIDFSIKKGQFIMSQNVKTDSIIDLNGQYVIPPLGDAHTHNLVSLYDLDKMSKKYIDEGVFYVQVLGGTHKGRLQVSSKLNDSVLEVQYSNGGITSTLGHPFSIAEPLAMGIHNPNEKRKRRNEIRKSRIAENDAYWFFDTKDDVDAKWQNLINTKPDVIKIMLFDAKNYDKLHKDTLTIGKKGLSKTVAEHTIKKAKKDNLRVFAHIETADDFNLAVELGVDIIAHIPGYSWRGNDEDLGKFTLTQEDLQKASKRNITVITTASLSLRYLREHVNGTPQVSKEKLLRVIAFQKNQINMLMANGVDVALGADQYQKTVMSEVDYLHRYKILNPEQILDIITRVNPQMILPNRKIGEIKDGYEASFLVLEKNPLADMQSVKKIDFRVKKGVVLN